MKSLILSLALILAVPFAASAQVPYNDNSSKGPGAQVPASSPYITTGNVPRRTGFGTVNGTGSQVAPTAWLYLAGPAEADADWFVDGAAATSTGAFLALLNNDSVRGYSRNQINDSTNEPFIRNFTVTPSQATTGTLTLGVVLADYTIEYHDVSFTNSSSVATTAYTGLGLVSAKVKTGFTAGTTLDVGFGKVFGFPVPVYANTVGNVTNATTGFVFASSTGGYPTTAQGYTFVGGLPATTAADDFGTLVFANDPDGTYTYGVYYLPNPYWFSGKAYPHTALDLP